MRSLIATVGLALTCCVPAALAQDVAPTTQDHRRLDGWECVQRGDYAAALERFDAALAVNPQDALTIAKRGVALDLLRRDEEALACFDRCLALLQPTDSRAAWVLRQRAEFYRNRKQYDHAAHDFRLAARIVPADPMNLIPLAICLCVLDRLDEAQHVAARACEVAPRDSRAYRILGVTLAHASDYKAALVQFDRAIALEPKRALYHYDRALALSNLGDHAGSLEGARRALSLEPDKATRAKAERLVAFAEDQLKQKGSRAARALRQARRVIRATRKP